MSFGMASRSLRLAIALTAALRTSGVAVVELRDHGSAQVGGQSRERRERPECGHADCGSGMVEEFDEVVRRQDTGTADGQDRAGHQVGRR